MLALGCLIASTMYQISLMMRLVVNQIDYEQVDKYGKIFNWSLFTITIVTVIVVCLFY